MKYWTVERITEAGEMRLADRDPPGAGPGQYVVRVEAAGVNFLDTLMVRGRYQRRPELPFTPGVECAGTILAAGAGCALVVGQRICATLDTGGYAEAALVPESEHNLSVTLKNGTGRVLNVMGAPSFCGPDGCATIAGLPQVVPSGGTCRIAVRFQAGGPGPFAHEVPVYTDCPGQPEVMMRIVGDVSKSPTISAVEAGIAQSVRGAKP